MATPNNDFIVFMSTNLIRVIVHFEDIASIFLPRDITYLVKLLLCILENYNLR